jgi:hypothetical protein
MHSDDLCGADVDAERALVGVGTHAVNERNRAAAYNCSHIKTRGRTRNLSTTNNFIVRLSYAICVAFACASLASPALAASILFIGNSFTYGQGSPVRSYRPDAVTDLNHESAGGVPALFKTMTVEAGLDYDVYLETHGSAGLQWHLDNRRREIDAQAWNVVVMQGYSMLDPKRPGDAGILVASVRAFADHLQSKNPNVQMFLTATWPRADLVYLPQGHWYGKSVQAMAGDIRAGYDQAAASSPAIKRVIPVGEAWVRAIRTGVAGANPYDGMAADRINLWGRDNHHASTLGYYLEALVIFGSITGRDPRTLGDDECAGATLGIATATIAALEQVAFDQLAASGVDMAPLSNPRLPKRCLPASARP